MSVLDVRLMMFVCRISLCLESVSAMLECGMYVLDPSSLVCRMAVSPCVQLFLQLEGRF